MPALLLTLGLLACDGEGGDSAGEPDAPTGPDADGDGLAAPADGGGDCDDADAAVSDLCVGTVPAGTFEMGSPEGEVGRHVGEVLHAVTLTRGYQVGLTEVTRGQFAKRMGYDPSALLTCEGDDCPVDSVTWHEAALFTSVLSAEAGLGACYACEGGGREVTCAPVEDPYACLGWRLPTEAEWERAARAGTASAFPNGASLVGATETACTDPLALDDGSSLGDLAWFCGNAEERAHPVATLAPNAWGLSDTSGNLWEWAHDWHGELVGDAVSDPSGPPDGATRVRRGGSWFNFPQGQRAATRDHQPPDVPQANNGLRIARTLP